MTKSKFKVFEYSILIVFALILCTIGLSACQKSDPKTYSVSFVVDGSVYHSDTIDWDKPTVFPTDPTKVGYDF